MGVKTDRGLHIRLLVTLTLIFVTTVVLAWGAWFLLDTLAAAVALFTDSSPAVVLRLFALAGVLCAVAYVVLARYDPEPLATAPTDEEGPDGNTTEPPATIESTLTRLAQQVDVPRPDLRVLDTEVPNAYTGGYRPSRSTITVTTGLLDRLDEREVAAVLAHELVHVVHRDQLVVTLAAAPLSIAWRLRAFADERWAEFAEHGTHPLLGVGTVAVFAVAAVFGFVGRTVVTIHSRYREFAADGGSVAITGAPASLAGVLRKLDDTTVPRADMREATTVPPVRAFISPEQFLDDEFRNRWTGGVSSWFDPHPTTDDRIDHLRERYQ